MKITIKVSDYCEIRHWNTQLQPIALSDSMPFLQDSGAYEVLVRKIEREVRDIFREGMRVCRNLPDFLEIISNQAGQDAFQGHLETFRIW